MENFAIYCSGKASRVIGFYENEFSKKNFSPLIIIYDGQDLKILEKLRFLFRNKLIYFNISKYSLNEKEKIHQTTSDFILKSLISYNCKYLICFGDKILKKNLVSKFEKKLINFHPSLLPAFPGLNAIDQALNTKSVFLGNTVHYINENIDTGEIIAQSVMLAKDFNNYEDVLELQFPLFKLILRDVLKFDVSKSQIIEDIKDRKKKYLIPKECNQ